MRVMRGLPSIRSVAARLAIALVAGSILAMVLRRATGITLYLVPELVLVDLALWQPLTWVILEDNPMGVVFGALILWSMGGMLEMSWGSRRLLQFCFGVTFTSGLLTLAVALPLTSLRGMLFAGGTVAAGAIWVAYGLSIGRGQTNFWGLPVTGNVLALIGVGFVVLSAVFGSWQTVIPSAFGLPLSAAYVKFGGPRVLWLRFTSWRLQRRLRSRSKHLRVIAPDRNTRGDSDRFLH